MPIYDTIAVAIPHGILLLSDVPVGDAPNSIARELVTATQTTIALGTLHAAEGDVQISVASEPASPQADLSCSFVAPIRTPNGQFAVYTTAMEPLIAVRTGFFNTVVQIYVDDPSEPCRVLLVITSGPR